jgi:hypothetical protein
MNQLHFEYKMNTGNYVHNEAETIKEDYEKYPFLADYIQWLEDRINLLTGGKSK